MLTMVETGDVTDVVHLARDSVRVPAINTLASTSGLTGLLEDLNRTAHRRRVPGRLVDSGFRLDAKDSVTLRWWPQGITTSADHSDQETYAGRHIVVTSSYSKQLGRWGRASHGSRLTFFDISEKVVRYRHVLLVDALWEEGQPHLKPVRIHAGGIVWRGPSIHVAGTAAGLFSFHIDDIVKLPKGADLGLGFPADYVLPLRSRYKARTPQGHPRMRYSFVSLSRSGTDFELVCGEYGQQGETTRLISFDFDGDTGLLKTDPLETGSGTGEAAQEPAQEAISVPTVFELGGVQKMQGAVRVDGEFYITQSRNRIQRGNLWRGDPGSLTISPCALPAGPEDICHWPSTDQLWSVSEHPLQRYVFCVNRGALAN